jgi:hypothetical protein
VNQQVPTPNSVSVPFSFISFDGESRPPNPRLIFFFFSVSFILLTRFIPELVNSLRLGSYLYSDLLLSLVSSLRSGLPVSFNQSQQPTPTALSTQFILHSHSPTHPAPLARGHDGCLNAPAAPDFSFLLTAIAHGTHLRQRVTERQDSFFL